MELYAITLHPAVGNDVRDCLNPLPVPRHKPSPQTAPIVMTQFVTTRNDIGFVREKAQTISFVERGFGRLSLGHRTVVYRGIHIELNRVRSRSLSPGGGLGGFCSWPFFPPLSGLLASLFILACIPYPTSTCRFDFLGLILVPSAHTQSG